MTIATTTYHRSQHLGAAELLPESAGCPWCGGRDRVPLSRLQERPDVDLLECRGCHACSASLMPTEATLAAYYGSYYDDENFKAGAGAKVTIGDPRRMGRSLARWMESRATLQAIRILDFGGGDGTVAAKAAAELLRAGVISHAHVTVVDYNDETAHSPNPQIEIERFRDLDEIPAREFDVVMASAVLEHIPDGRRAVDRLLELVRPGGVFYARTPQMAAFVRLADRLGLRLDFTYPGHVHDLGQRFWEDLFNSPAMAAQFGIVLSKPSLVEACFRQAPLRALLVHACKLPWYLLGRRWSFVGGWEIVVESRLLARATE
jgi:SAM-dependent methyltransferase